MEKDCTGLLETMAKQLEIYRNLLSLALEKQPVLVNGSIPELEKITREEELLIIQVGRLEEQRQNLHQALASHFLLSPEQLTLTELIKRTKEDNAEAFKRVFSELTDVLKELTDINQSNTELIKSSLDFIDFSIGMFSDTDKSPGYNGEDEEKKPSSAKIFDHKV